MPNLRLLKKDLQYFAGLYPSIWQLNPLKIYEFQRLVAGVRLAPGQRILDLGCGYGVQAELLARQGPAVVGVDPGAEILRQARRRLKWSRVRARVHYRVGTLEQLDLPPASLDYVFSFCVLEHIPNLEEVLCVVARLLKPGGELHTTVDALTTVTDPAILEHHRREYLVYRYFRPDTVRTLLAAAGLEVFECRYLFASAAARDEMVHGLQTGSATRKGRAKRAIYAQVAAAEATIAAPDAGLMLLVRARKPAGTGRAGQPGDAGSAAWAS